ncbi:MAG: phospholipase D-like domain-containing protein [Nitrospirota bacterium]
MRTPFVKQDAARSILAATVIPLLLLAASGCATLPDAEALFDRLPEFEGLPLIVGAQGPLSPKERRAALQQLRKEGVPTDILERHIKVMELVSGRVLVSGNRATLLKDDPVTFDAMLDAIADAKDHVNLETFIFSDDEVGSEFADLLLEKQSEGVQVNLIIDGLGSFKTPSEFFAPLRAAGARTVEFNPVSLRNPAGLLRITHRDHRKILVVDGEVAFTGGTNIADICAQPSFAFGIASRGAPLEKRDTNVRIEGPAAAEFQKLFLDIWREQNGPELPLRRYFPQPEHKGNDLVRVIDSSPRRKGYGTAHLLYLSAIEHAASSIRLTNAYFIPDRQLLKALKEASARGVDISLIVPGVTDNMIAVHGGRYYYSALLDAGVKIYERQGMILHAKTAVIDGVWSTIGSTNLDHISLVRMDEVNAVILSREFGAEMEALFAGDLRESKQILPEEWQARPLLPRLVEWFSSLFLRVL